MDCILFRFSFWQSSREAKPPPLDLDPSVSVKSSAALATT